MIFELTGKSALVTGAGSGIGAAIAETFARAGARVFVSDVQIATATETAQRITNSGGSATPVALDVRDEEACAEVGRQTGPLDVLVNNAGIGHVGTALTTTGADLDRLYAVNVRGMLNVTRVYLPDMVAKHKGAIVNMASVAGLVGAGGLSAYVASKHAVVGMTRVAAIEYAKEGIRVNAVCPGVIDTPMVDRLSLAMPNLRETLLAMKPMGRLGLADEVAAAIVWLCSDAASFVTGHALAVDGGYVAQ